MSKKSNIFWAAVEAKMAGGAMPDVFINPACKVCLNNGWNGAEFPARLLHLLPAADKASPVEVPDYEDWSEIEGNLELASRHNGKQFVVWDRITGHRTTCNVSREFFVQALDALKAEEIPRAWVSGRTKYKKGLPALIDVEEFRLLPSLSEAIDPSFFQGINITGGIDPVIYLRSMMGDA